MQPIAEASGVELQATFEPEHLRVLADPEDCSNRLDLLSNAIKFSVKGGIVRLAAGSRGGHFRLTVEDHGAGISPEFLPRVFDRFSQGDASITRRHAGLGIGLTIVKQLVEMQHGTITAASKGAGQGATFTLELPLTDDAGATTRGDSQRNRVFNLAGAVVLLVEDDDDTRELTSRILREVGARVIEARSAEAALSRVLEGDANVLISDIGMANQDGYQLLREIRRRGHGAQELPAIALTAFARMEDRESALAAGFQEHLVKPIEGQYLISRIADRCGRGNSQTGRDRSRASDRRMWRAVPLGRGFLLHTLGQDLAADRCPVGVMGRPRARRERAWLGRLARIGHACAGRAGTRRPAAPRRRAPS